MINLLKNKIASYRLKRGFRKLSEALKNVKTPMNAEDVIDFLFSKKAELITPWQYKSEITGLFKAYEKTKAKFALEIGTANGGTLFGHCKLAQDNSTIISVDLPGGKFGGGYPDWKMPIYKSFAKPNQSLHLIRASSHESSTIEKVKGILKGNQLDYLFIDGDHTYDGVKKDFELYSPFVKPGGLVIFHDIVPHEGSACKVDEFWNEIKLEHPYQEFIDRADQSKYGVGIITFK